jgi:surface protein
MAPLSRRERALAHLRSAIRYERKGLAKKAVAHFGRAMHYGAFEDLTKDSTKDSTKDRTQDLPDEVIKLIIEMALKGKSSEVLSTMAQVDQRFRKLVPEANFFRYASVKDTRTHPLFALAWREIANEPFDAWLMGPAQSHGGDSSKLLIAIKQLFERSVSEWYHFRPDLFHPMVKILPDTTSSDRKYQLARDKLRSFMEHLDSGPCAECAILQKEGPSGPKEQIRRIINKEFRPAEIGQSEDISVLVYKYFTDPTSADLRRYGHLCVWNTGAVTNMSRVFPENRWKNGEWDVRLWDTGCVASMTSAFTANTAGQFSGVEFWNTRNVDNMSGMFYGALSFDQNIGNWNTQKVENMSTMFYGAESFNQDIGKWNTRNVRSTSGMFNGARSFNQDIGTWDTRNVDNMSGMFYGARSFNQDISKWNTQKVASPLNMFDGATAVIERHQPVFLR